MGQASDDVLEGRACSVCGVWLEEYLNDEQPDGYGFPVACEECDSLIGERNGRLKF